MIRVNLHIHSTCSDGVFTPTELVHLLYQNGVSIASLTDHDTAAGVPEFLSGCRKHNIRGVAGVEFSSVFRLNSLGLDKTQDSELHILAYRFDLNNTAINAVFDEYCRERENRNARVCERLVELGCAVTMDEVRARAGSRVVGRPHIAQVLKDKGYVETIRQAFVRYLAEGAPAYIPRKLMTSEKIIRLILDAGGLPVWAHPLSSLVASNLGETAFTDVLDRLKDCGLRGVECWFHGATSGQIFTCLNETGRRGLFATAGTDFHGRVGHSAKISGRIVPDDLLPWARFCGGR